MSYHIYWIAFWNNNTLMSW